MKKLACFIFLAVIIISFSVSALAGDVPEGLLHEDGAQVFFGEVVSFEPSGEIPYVEVIPTKKIKGDVIVDGSCATYQKANAVGDFNIKVGKNYLFTYFDEVNATNIFEVTSYNTSTLKLKNVHGDMWERFERYLNEGRYEDAEHARLERENERLATDGEDISFVELLGVSEDKAEDVNIHYEGKVHEIDVEEFYSAIDGVMLTDIENVSLEKRVGDKVYFTNGMYITVNGLDGFAFISDDCKVDKNGPHFSKLPVGAYSIEFDDRVRIMALFTSDESKLPFLETSLARNIFYIVLGAILLFAVAFTIGFSIKKRR